MNFTEPKTREEWLEARKKGIGGSDAACVLGRNKYKTNVQLWKEKTGICQAKDISDNPAVVYGKKAESHLRELFILDFPEYTVDYHEYRMYANDDYPFIFATLDGEITNQSGLRGVLEIKTCTIRNPVQWDDWEDRLPDTYYVQVLHQLLATGWDFAVLKVHIRYFKNGDLRAIDKHYLLERKDEKESLKILLNAEISFWEHVKNKSEPALILPEI